MLNFNKLKFIVPFLVFVGLTSVVFATGYIQPYQISTSSNPNNYVLTIVNGTSSWAASQGGGGGSTTTINSVLGPTFFFNAGAGLSISSSSNIFTYTNTAPNYNTTTSINGMTGAIIGLNIYNTTTSINGLTGAIIGANLFNTSTTINGSAGAFTGVNLFNTTTSVNGLTGNIIGLNIFNSTTSVNGMTGAIIGLNLYNSTTTIGGLTDNIVFATSGISIATSGQTMTFTNLAPNFNTTTSVNGLTGNITGLNIFNTTTSVNGLVGAINGLNIFNTTTTVNGMSGTINGLNIYNTTTTWGGLTGNLIIATSGISVATSSQTITFTNLAPNYNTTTSINTMTGAITGLNLYNATTTVNGMSGAITGLNIYNTTTTLAGLNGAITISTSTVGASSTLNFSTSTNTLTLNVPQRLLSLIGVGTTTGNLIVGTSTPLGWAALAPGTDNTCLTASSTKPNGLAWGACGSGGATSPGGSDTQIQFNNAGSFGADSGLTFSNTTKTLTLGGPLVVSSTTAESAILVDAGGVFTDISVVNPSFLASSTYKVVNNVNPTSGSGILFSPSLDLTGLAGTVTFATPVNLVNFSPNLNMISKASLINENGTINMVEFAPMGTGSGTMDTINIMDFSPNLNDMNVSTINELSFSANAGAATTTNNRALLINSFGGSQVVLQSGSTDKVTFAGQVTAGANVNPGANNGSLSVGTAGISPGAGVAGTAVPFSVFLTNRSASTTVINDLYIFDVTSANSISSTTLASSTLVACVAQTAAANGSLTRCAVQGQVSINATGTITVGDRLCTSNGFAGKAAGCNNSPTLGAVIGRATQSHGAGAASAIKAIIGVQ